MLYRKYAIIQGQVRKIHLFVKKPTLYSIINRPLVDDIEEEKEAVFDEGTTLSRT